jgi:manganese transport protein
MSKAYAVPLTLTERTVRAGRLTLRGQARGLRALLPFAGPAVIASVAYMDPGNFATNLAAGAGRGYDLLWMVVLASAIAMLFQALSAKLGIATGRSLAAASRDCFPRPVVWGMWVASEVAAMATDLAEFIGGAVGLSLLFGLPLLAGMAVAGAVTYALLLLQGRGFRPLELVIGGFVALIGASYVVELALAPLDWPAVAYHAVVPSLGGPEALTLAVAIIGATVMPHAIFLHSGLTHDRIVPRSEGERRKLIRYSNREVVLALGVAGLVNMAMVAVAAAVFHDPAGGSLAGLATAYRMLVPLLGYGAAGVFLVSLIASGLSSSVVATMAGQVIMQDFVGFQIPIWVRRLVTMVPSFIVVALAVDTMRALVLSQVVLSLVLPIPMIALLVLTRHPAVMGAAVNRRLTSALGAVAAGVVLSLNALLLLHLCGFSAADLTGSPAALAIALASASLIGLLFPGWSSRAVRPLKPPAGAAMVLTLVEQDESGEVIARGSPASWNPRMVLPAEIDALDDPATGGVTVALPADWLDAVGLQVSPPAGASGLRRFRILGMVDGRPAAQIAIAVDASGAVERIAPPSARL